jgi:hypothetical protein
MHGRYFLFPIYSLWTEVLASPGKRTFGTGAQTIAITGPGWNGTLPSGVTQQVKSSTGIVFIIGRVYADGSATDYAAVHALQRQFKLYPLSAWGKSYAPPPGKIDPNAPSPKEIVRNVIKAMDAQAYFGLMAKLMKVNPAVLPADAPIVGAMAKIGLQPGQDFGLSMAGRSQPRAASTARTICAGLPLQRSAGVRTSPRTQSIRSRASTPMASRSMVPIDTCCISRKARRHRSRGSGRLRCTTPNSISTRTRSTNSR